MHFTEGSHILGTSSSISQMYVLKIGGIVENFSIDDYLLHLSGGSLKHLQSHSTLSIRPELWNINQESMASVYFF